MRRPDPLRMLADIASLASERPDLDAALVRGIYQYQAATEGRLPSIRRAREYIDHLTSNLDEDTIRLMVGLPAQRRVRARARTARPRGRPKGTGLLTVAAVLEANRDLRASRRGRAATQEALAERLEVSARTLQDFLKDNGLTWPLAD